MVVIDASVMGPLLIPDEAKDRREGLIEQLIAGNGLVPCHWYLEVANMGMMAVRRGRLSWDEFGPRLNDIFAFPIEVEPAPDLATSQRIARIAHAGALTIYDAVYLEVAERRGLPLLSLDRALSAAARSIGIELE